jgi:hypothetical protein
LTIDQILAWADAFHGLSDRWPNRHGGSIPGSGGENWSAVDAALTQGYRGLPKGGSLIKLLAEHRGYRHRSYLPPLSVEQILAWADEHHTRTGSWPTELSGPVGTTGESWQAINRALRDGERGLPGGTSLFKLLRQAGRVPSAGVTLDAAATRGPD